VKAPLNWSALIELVPVQAPPATFREVVTVSANRAAVREHKSVRRKLPYIHGLPKAEMAVSGLSPFRETGGIAVIDSSAFAMTAPAPSIAVINGPEKFPC